VLREKTFDRSQIVVRNIQRQFRQSLRNSWALGDAKRGEAGTGLREKMVSVAVIAPFKFDDEVAASESAREANRTHGGFGTAGNKADFIEERNGAADSLSELDLEFRGYAVAGSLLCLIGNRRNDSRMRVAEQHGPPRADEVEQPVAVRIEQILSSAAFDDERFAADGAERADGAVDATDENLFSVGENFAGAAAAVLRRRLRCHLRSIIWRSKSLNSGSPNSCLQPVHGQECGAT
jgi:hypothetical protein